MGMQSPIPPSSDQTCDWTDRVPADLKLRLLDSLSYSTATADDLWDEIREWLSEHKIQPSSEIELLVEERPLQVRGSQKYERTATMDAPEPERVTRTTFLKASGSDTDRSSDRLFAEAAERRRLVDLENAVLDYAAKFGVSDAARIAMRSGIRK